MPLGMPSQVQLHFSSQKSGIDLSGKVAIAHFALHLGASWPLQQQHTHFALAHQSIVYAAEMSGKIAGGNHDVTFLGWNNILKKNVDRYLIVDNQCWQSEESITSFDPFTPMLGKFKSAGAWDGEPGEPGTELYKYSDGSVTAEMVTGAGGKPEQSAAVQAKESFTSEYTDYSSKVDGCSGPFDSCSLFYKYENFSCKKVSPSALASMPYMQITDWLVLEYPQESVESVLV